MRGDVMSMSSLEGRYYQVSNVITYLSHTCAFIKSENQEFSNHKLFEFIFQRMQTAKYVIIVKEGRILKNQIENNFIAADIFLLLTLYHDIFSLLQLLFHY